MPIKIFLVDDHRILREGIASLIEKVEDIQVIGDAGNGMEALEKLEKLRPDVVLMDMSMPEMNGLECTRRIKEEYPVMKVLVLSMQDHESYLIDMLDAGADGYILKNTTIDEMTFAIRKIAGGGMYICPEFTMSMLAKYKAVAVLIGQAKKTHIQLSQRESDVLKLIADGLTNVEIAKKIFLSRRTVETHRKNLLEKTGTTNTATLIRFAVLNALIK